MTLSTVVDTDLDALDAMHRANSAAPSWSTSRPPAGAGPAARSHWVNGQVIRANGGIV